MQQAERSGTLLLLREIDAAVVTGVCGLRKRVAAFSRRSMSQHWGTQMCAARLIESRVPDVSRSPFMAQAEGPGAFDAIKRNAAKLAACKTLASPLETK